MLHGVYPRHRVLHRCGVRVRWLSAVVGMSSGDQATFFQMVKAEASVALGFGIVSEVGVVESVVVFCPGNGSAGSVEIFLGCYLHPKSFVVGEEEFEFVPGCVVGYVFEVTE